MARVRIAGNPNLLALALVSGVSPFATDTYIAALPAVQDDLDTTASAAQLTMTAFLVGFAVGQLVCGPVSDATGRRRILIVFSAAFGVLSAVCAAAPNAALLIAARGLQGFAGGCGLAVGRAVVSDRHTGGDAAVRYGALASIMLLAPVVAPAIGGVILLVGDWRTIFLFLAGLGVVMTAAVFIGIPETLPVGARSPAGLAETRRRMAGLLRQRPYLGAVIVQCLAIAGFFTYIGGSSFVLQDDLGLSASEYSLLFASNAAAMALVSVVFTATVRRVGLIRWRAIGLVTSTAAAVALAAYAIAVDEAHLAPVWVLLAVAVAGMGVTIPASIAIAQGLGRSVGGTASALQGGLSFAIGAAATPLTGLTGQTSVEGMSLLMASFFICSAGVLVATRAPTWAPASSRPDD
jgi:DHA1 family bicyclomycin/chloramphenicol resistance-like MFS transporter